MVDHKSTQPAIAPSQTAASNSSSPGVIVHEWVARTGGAERVLSAMAAVFPEAPIHTLWADDHSYGERVVETWLARSPLRQKKALAMPAMTLAWRRLHAGQIETALISSHVFAHHAAFIDRPNVRKYVYVHTPARYLWAPEHDGRGSNPLVSAVAPVFKRLDRMRSREIARVATNSEFVRKRVESSWGLDAEVIYPPVDVVAIQSGWWRDELSPVELEIADKLPPAFVLGASRMVRYKRVDMAIEVGELLGLPVVIAGDGPEMVSICKIAEASTVPVHVLGRVSDALMRKVMESASLYVFPPVEDFGIIPVEAMALGTPVLANEHGGAAESVVDNISGALVDFRSKMEIASAAERALRLNPRKIAQSVARFDSSRFNDEIRRFVGK